MSPMSEEQDTNRGEVIVYETADGAIRVDVRLERETVWLTQQQMAELFGRERSVVTKHLRNVFKEGELDREAVCAKFAHTDFSFNSPSLKIFLICLVITVRSLAKSSVICFCVSHTVSSSSLTSICWLPSSPL